MYVYTSCNFRRLFTVDHIGKPSSKTEAFYITQFNSTDISIKLAYNMTMNVSTYSVLSNGYIVGGYSCIHNIASYNLYIYIYICYSYIPLRVGYHCYYTSPRRSRGRVLITMISYECSGI